METQKTKTNTTKKVLNICLNVVLWLFVAFAIVMTIFAISSRSNKENVPSLGKKVLVTVLTDSMKPTFKSGDLIIVNKLSDDEKKELQVGDVITFHAGDLNGDGKDDLNSHRITSLDLANNRVHTKGDAPTASEENVLLADIVGIYRGTKLAGVGSFIAFLGTFLGFGLIVVLPLVAFFVFELVVFIRKYNEVRNEGKKVITEEDEEMIKQRAVEEYLRKVEAEKKEDNKEEDKEE